MFLQIFLFEIKYRLRRPAFYIYFLMTLLLCAFSFAKGNVPAGEKEFINSPHVLASLASMMTIFMMLVSATIMGVPLYRDIEFGTKEYYLSYPITKPGYFWGRYLGSFVFVALTGAAVLLGAWLGSLLGPVLGWQSAARYQPNRFIYYWHPFLTIILPNLFFTSSIFFGLVAVFRNVKVIYSGGMLLFLGYIFGNFFLHNINNRNVIYLTDPFLFNALRYETGGLSPDQLNHSVLHMQGLLLENRILWTGVSVVVVLLTYWYFSFERFFAGRQGKSPAGREAVAPVRGIMAPAKSIRLDGPYYRRVLGSLTRIELLNIIRDSYLWIILSGGIFFLGFVFLHGPGNYGVADYPRTAFFMDVFNETFLFFGFLIVAFYTGETVHREKLTRYNLINDTLPPPTWLLNCSKLLSLLCLGVFLALIPFWLGLIVQIAAGYPYLNVALYVSSELVSILPRMMEIVLFCYGVQVLMDNKFAALGVTITIWTALFAMTNMHYADYYLFLFSYTPNFWTSDMDGIGHMVKPVSWYNSYWTVFGILLVLGGSLFYARGTRGSLREKFALASERFSGWSRMGILSVFLLFLCIGGYIYYNVSYLNEYLTSWERNERAAVTEKQLKHYTTLPLPRVTQIDLHVDLFPNEQREESKAAVTLVNREQRAIDSLLLDGDNLDYSLSFGGAELSYTCPLYYQRGSYSWFRPRKETSDYRVYRLPRPLLPGDSITLNVSSVVAFRGFRNDLYASAVLHNAIFTNGNMPGMGYDEGDELHKSDDRKEHGLPVRQEREIQHTDPLGIMGLRSGISADLVKLDITVSTAADQLAVAPGRLEKESIIGGRHYFHYVQDNPSIYLPYAILSSRYAILSDTARLADGRVVGIKVFYTPTNGLNVSHIQAALKDGLHYYSQVLGPYPFDQISVVQTSTYASATTSMPGVITLGEPNTGWNADLRGSDKLDYLYYNVIRQLARQWWGQQVAPNNTVGSGILTGGVPDYMAIDLFEQRFGKVLTNRVTAPLRWIYDWRRQTNFDGEHDLLHANSAYLSNEKATLALYGLAQTAGADTLRVALREMFQQWAFQKGPYAGVMDLYGCLQRHVPDSLKGYLSDGWEKVILYDNRVVEATVTPLQKDSGYRVRVRVAIAKTRQESKGKWVDVRDMNDPVDIGVFGSAKGPIKGPAVLADTTFRWTAGEHAITFVVKEKPVYVQIDPFRKLLDRADGDNRQDIQ